MSADQPTIIYTLTDEAPLLATYSFCRSSGRSSSRRHRCRGPRHPVAARILAEFGDYLTEDQRVP